MARLDTPRTLRDRLYRTFRTRAPATATRPGGAPRHLEICFRRIAQPVTPEEALTMRSLIRVTGTSRYGSCLSGMSVDRLWDRLTSRRFERPASSRLPLAQDPDHRSGPPA